MKSCNSVGGIFHGYQGLAPLLLMVIVTCNDFPLAPERPSSSHSASASTWGPSASHKPTSSSKPTSSLSSPGLDRNLRSQSRARSPEFTIVDGDENEEPNDNKNDSLSSPSSSSRFFSRPRGSTSTNPARGNRGGSANASPEGINGARLPDPTQKNIPERRLMVPKPPPPRIPDPSSSTTTNPASSLPEVPRSPLWSNMMNEIDDPPSWRIARPTDFLDITQIPDLPSAASSLGRTRMNDDDTLEDEEEDRMMIPWRSRAAAQQAGNLPTAAQTPYLGGRFQFEVQMRQSPTGSSSWARSIMEGSPADPSIMMNSPPPINNSNNNHQIKVYEDNNNNHLNNNLKSRIQDQLLKLSVTVDPDAAWRLAPVLVAVAQVVGTTAWTALRLSTPLWVAQRLFALGVQTAHDWYMGRYLRTTYEHHRHYLLEAAVSAMYWLPAPYRSTGRLLVNYAFLWIVQGWVVDRLSRRWNIPCRLDDTRVIYGWWCSIPWLLFVTVVGNLFAEAVSIWGGPLAVQDPKQPPKARRSSLAGPNGLKTPFLRWLRHPHRWIRQVIQERAQRRAAGETLLFKPEAYLFPVTWKPLRIFQLIALVREMAICVGPCRLMLSRLFIFQQIFSDEWFRALLAEEELAMGVISMAGCLLATAAMFWVALDKPHAAASPTTIFLMLPFVLAALVSTWMTVVLYMDRIDGDRPQRAEWERAQAEAVAAEAAAEATAEALRREHTAWYPQQQRPPPPPPPPYLLQHPMLENSNSGGGRGDLLTRLPAIQPFP